VLGGLGGFRVPFKKDPRGSLLRGWGAKNPLKPPKTWGGKDRGGKRALKEKGERIFFWGGGRFWGGRSFLKKAPPL